MLSIIAVCLSASCGALARWSHGLWLSPGGLLLWGTRPPTCWAVTWSACAWPPFNRYRRWTRSYVCFWSQTCGLTDHLLHLFYRSDCQAAATALRPGSGHRVSTPVWLAAADGGEHLKRSVFDSCSVIVDRRKPRVFFGFQGDG